MYRTTILATMLLAAATGTLRAAIAYDVTLDTSPLVGHAAGPFTLSFQLTDGSGTGDGNNTISLTNFQFGAGGSAAGSPVTTAGASGSLASGITLTDSAFFVNFDQMFTPGSTLSFMLGFTNNVDPGPTPDQFSFLVLDSAGNPLPTASLGSLGVDVFLTADLSSASPVVRTFASDRFRFPSAGDPLVIAAPSADLVGAAVPEPATVTTVLTALLGIAAVSLRRRT